MDAQTDAQTDASWRLERLGLLGRWQVTEGGTTLAEIGTRTVRHGGEIQLGGTTYTLETGGFGRRCRLSGPDGRVVASAERQGGGWHVTTSGRDLELVPGPGRDLQLREAGHVIGTVRRPGVGSGVVADMPGIDPPARLLMLLAIRARQSRQRRVVAVAR